MQLHTATPPCVRGSVFTALRRHRTRVRVNLFLSLLIISSLLLAPLRDVLPGVPGLGTAPAVAATSTYNACDLYPIALHTQSLAGLAVGDPIPDIYNGGQPGNFGWMTWAGSPSDV